MKASTNSSTHLTDSTLVVSGVMVIATKYDV